MSRKTLMRCVAFLMATMFVTTLTFGLRPMWLAAGVLGIVIWSIYWELVESPIGKAPSAIRRELAHEQSQEFLSRFDATPLCSRTACCRCPNSGLQSWAGGCYRQSSASRYTHRSYTLRNGRSNVNAGYRSRDRPW